MTIAPPSFQPAPSRPSALRARLAAARASPTAYLMAMGFTNMLGFAGWSALFNNFAHDAAGFGGFEVGLAQTVREVPGLLAFTAIYWMLVVREQTLAYVALGLLGLGVALTGFFPTLTGLLLTTTIMSLGFHYFETTNQSLALQLIPKREAPRVLGRVSGAGSVANFIAYGGIAALWFLGFRDYASLFALVGAACLVLTALGARHFPRFEGTVAQRKRIVLRRRYWLYYALTFMSGARRQVFTAFGGFLLVERFGYSVGDVALLMLVTSGLGAVFAPRLGALIGRAGERPTIMLENAVLIAVFAGYALAEDGRLAGALFVLDGVFLTLVIAQRTYFQKIGDPADMAPTAAVAFTINHVAAVFLPVTFGLIWLAHPSLVFVIGAGIATVSLALAFLGPRDPGPGNETTWRAGDARAGAPGLKGAPA